MELKAVSCLIGGLLVNLTIGTFYSIGNVVSYIASYLRNIDDRNPNVTKEDGIWITASFLLGQGLFIIAGSYIERKFNSRIAIIIGCLIHCTSTFLTIVALKVNFLSVVLVYGLGCGLGCGSSYVAAIIAVQRWFPHKKGFFTGLVVGGFGFGGTIFAPLQTLFMNPTNQKSEADGYYGKTVYEKVPDLFLYMGILFTCAQSLGCLMSYPPPPSPTPSSVNNRLKASNANAPNNNSNTIISEPVLPDIKSLYSVFTHKIFYIIGLMMMLVAPGVTFVNTMNKSYGEIFINDDRFLTIVVAMAGVTNALGRVTWGFLIDKFSFRTCFTIKVVLFATLIGLFPYEFVLNSKFLYVVWVLGLFFGFSGTFVLFPVFTEQVFGPDFHGAIYGINYLLLSASSLLTAFMIKLGPSASDKNSQSLMSRVVPCTIIASLYISALALYLLTTPFKRLERAIEKRTEANLMNTSNSLISRQDLYPLERGTLAEKTQALKGQGLSKENSLGSIVRIRVQSDDGKIKPIK